MCLRLQVLSSAQHTHEGPFIPTSALSGMARLTEDGDSQGW